MIVNMLAPVDVETKSPTRPAERGWVRGAAVLAVLAVVGFAGFKLLRPGAPAAQGMPPADVTVAMPLARDVTEWDDYVGRFAARTCSINSSNPCAIELYPIPCVPPREYRAHAVCEIVNGSNVNCRCSAIRV